MGLERAVVNRPSVREGVRGRVHIWFGALHSHGVWIVRSHKADPDLYMENKVLWGVGLPGTRPE
jgi:hypothetical protein